MGRPARLLADCLLPATFKSNYYCPHRTAHKVSLAPNKKFYPVSMDRWFCPAGSRFPEQVGPILECSSFSNPNYEGECSWHSM